MTLDLLINIHAELLEQKHWDSALFDIGRYTQLHFHLYS